MLEAAVRRAADSAATLDYALRVTQGLVVSREFRFQARAPDQAAHACRMPLQC
jgi:hypothetical protein